MSLRDRTTYGPGPIRQRIYACPRCGKKHTAHGRAFERKACQGCKEKQIEEILWRAVWRKFYGG